jgi:polyhydroxyalkanoate synthesis regulator phasin
MGAPERAPTARDRPCLHGKEHQMDPSEVTTFIDDLHTAVQENPEAARQKVANLKAKIQTLSPEDQAQIREGIEELRSRVQNLPPEQQAQLQDIVATIRG